MVSRYFQRRLLKPAGMILRPPLRWEKDTFKLLKCMKTTPTALNAEMISWYLLLSNLPYWLLTFNKHYNVMSWALTYYPCTHTSNTRYGACTCSGALKNVILFQIQAAPSLVHGSELLEQSESQDVIGFPFNLSSSDTDGFPSVESFPSERCPSLAPIPTSLPISCCSHQFPIKLLQ